MIRKASTIINKPPEKQKYKVVRFCTSSSNIHYETFDEIKNIIKLQKNCSSFKITPKRLVRQFSINLRDYIKEEHQNSGKVFQDRLRQVIRYINQNDLINISDDIKVLVDYLREYLTHQMTIHVNENSSTNLFMELRVIPYLRDKSIVRVFNKYFTKAREQLINSGSMQKNIQVNLIKEFDTVMAELILGISDKVTDMSKKKLLEDISDTIRGDNHEEAV